MVTNDLIEATAAIGASIGASIAAVYTALIILAWIGMVLWHWLSDGDYDFVNPVNKLVMRAFGYIPCTIMTSNPYRKNGRDGDAFNVYLTVAISIILGPDIVLWLIQQWQGTSIVLGSIALLYTARFAIRISKKLEIHIKKGH